MNIINPYLFGGFTDPTDIAGLTLWLDANEGVYNDAGSTLATDGQTVQEWHDQSGNGNHVTQTTTGQKPEYRATGLNSSPSVDFVRANEDLLQVDGVAITAPFTYFVVASVDIELSGTNNLMLISTGDADTERADIFVNSFSGTDHRVAVFQFYTSTEETRTAGEKFLIADGAKIATAQFAATTGNSSIFLDGVDETDNTSGSISGAVTTQGFTIGNYWTGTVGTGWDGDISEVIIYDGALTAQEQSDVETYLANKWGITLS